MTSLATTFARESARFLREVHLPRLSRALETLPRADLWWQPHAGAIAVGTILRHLEGNVRQWILSGIGGADDRRDRAGEFAGSERPEGTALLERLAQTVNEASALIAGLGEAELLASYSIQGAKTTGLQAIYHVVEHFSWHTGQAVWIAKARAGAAHGLAFYDDAAINAARNG